MDIYRYSGTCIRRSPLGPGQLAVLQRWPAYTVYIEIVVDILLCMMEQYELHLMWQYAISPLQK